MEMKKSADNPLEAIGNTPLVKLNKITEGICCEVYAKLEFMNPMGSIKDRIAKYMIEKAEKEGRIKPGDLIIESSSGNTALGLALVAIQKGYRLKVIVRDSISREKIDQLRALGVEIHMVDHTLPPESPYSYNNIASLLAQEIPNCYFPDQHNNRENNETHYKTTGPEIWEQMEGKIDYFVAGIGTGGTICGVGKYLKEKDPNIKVIGIDPLGSVFYDYFHKKKKVKPKPYLIEGLGDEFLINCVDFSIIDDIYQVTDREAFLCTREIARKEGLLVGGSSGAAMWGVLKLAKKLNKPARIVTIFPDSASRYLSTIFNNKWMKERGFL
ncbi:cysteine synthase family protein [Candidatus Aminicenantes bacterium AC-335-A11]|jgi:cystathionine beta-synthase|nr:cysteine synthase family protein [SCandidatus Aminicenantes bacterium Aminicenantia_JdfR_composite]MCP2597980.1 cysteine synthase family protein [Candidatus Aminicenantes bacterium AC-335-L06]MCP2618184.1 cysteine synthase family protein [Candidatus Aminicenantes bacterium AC-335-A11]